MITNKKITAASFSQDEPSTFERIGPIAIRVMNAMLKEVMQSRASETFEKQRENRGEH